MDKKLGTQSTRIKSDVAERMIRFIKDVDYGNQSWLVTRAVEEWLDRNEQKYRYMAKE